MSFYFILPVIVAVGFLVYRYSKNQKNEIGTEPVKTPVESPEVTGRQVSDVSIAENESTENSNELSEDENWLLKQFVCFPDEYHTLKNVREVLGIGKADADWADGLVKSLTKKGWLIEPVHAEVFKMETAVAEKIMKTDPPTPDDIAVYAETVTNNLNIEKSIYEHVDDYPWVPFGKAILNRFENVEDETIALLQNEMGMVLNEMGDYEGAKESYADALNYYEKNLGTDHENTAVLYLNSANVHNQLGECSEAKVLLQKALRSYEKNLGELHPDTSLIYSYLAVVFQNLEEPGNAKPLLEKLLKADRHNFGNEHLNTATSSSNLARVCYACEDYDAALAHASESLDILQKVLPEGHEDILAMQNGVKVIKERMANVGMPG